MRFIFASDSFKGSLTSKEIAELLESAARDIFPGCETVSIPVADGGEGTIEALLDARKGERVYLDVSDPLMNQAEAYYGRLSETEAIIEMAQASGLTLVPPDKRNPLHTSTYGTGEMLKEVLNAGHRDIYLAIGGSATNDGGMGCMRALGACFYDASGTELQGFGRDLERVARIDLRGLHPGIRDTRFTVMCDVENPLCGKNGATYTFGPQKGGTVAILERLEAGMENYREVLIREFGKDPDDIPGSGAAGGLGAALCMFLKAEMRSGIETVLDLVKFDQVIKGADLIVTGEGRTDIQSSFGKVLKGVGERAQRQGIPAVALCGSLGGGYEKIFGHGISSIMTTVDRPMTIEEAMARAEELYYQGALRLFRMLRAGGETVTR